MKSKTKKKEELNLNAQIYELERRIILSEVELIKKELIMNKIKNEENGREN